MKNNIRIGKISAIDYAAGRVRVVYHDRDDAVTSLIPLLSSEYHMPAVGDQVIVLHLSDGSAAGIVLGRVWSDKNMPPESGAGLYRKDLSDKSGEAFIRYEGGVLKIHAGSIILDGDVTVTGTLTTNT